MKVKFKKLHEGAILPKKATEGSAAYDLYTPEDIIIKPGRQVIPLGFAMEMPIEIQALVDPRSGFSSKGMEGYEVLTLRNYETPLAMIANSVCLAREPERFNQPNTTLKKFVALESERFDCDVIEGKVDSDYRKGVGVIVHNRDSRTFLIKAGTRIAQMTFQKVETVEWEETDDLSPSGREGGFGSTGVS